MCITIWFSGLAASGCHFFVKKTTKLFIHTNINITISKKNRSHLTLGEGGYWTTPVAGQAWGDPFLMKSPCSQVRTAAVRGSILRCPNLGHDQTPNANIRQAGGYNTTHPKTCPCPKTQKCGFCFKPPSWLAGHLTREKPPARLPEHGAHHC